MDQGSQGRISVYDLTFLQVYGITGIQREKEHVLPNIFLLTADLFNHLASLLRLLLERQTLYEVDHLDDRYAIWEAKICEIIDYVFVDEGLPLVEVACVVGSIRVAEQNRWVQQALSEVMLGLLLREGLI